MRGQIVITSFVLCAAVAISLGASHPFFTGEREEKQSIQIITDTFPQGNIKIEVEEDGEKLRVSLNDGKIEKLTINGDEIPPTEFEKYQNRIAELLADAPPPPPETVTPPSSSSTPMIRTRSVRKTIQKSNEDGREIEVIIEQEMDEKVKRVIIDEEETLEHIKEREGQRIEQEKKRAEREVQRAEQQADRMAQTAKREAERIERAEERIEREEKRIERIAERQKNKNDWLEQTLLNDSLIEDKENYTVKLSNKRLKVNGKLASNVMHEKYMSLYQQYHGTDFSKDTSINITKKSN